MPTLKQAQSLVGKEEKFAVRKWKKERKKRKEVQTVKKNNWGEKEGRADWDKLSKMRAGSLVFSHVFVSPTYLVAIENKPYYLK